MAIIKDGEAYEYNIDGDLVPEGSVTLDNMYGDSENRYRPNKTPQDVIVAKERPKDAKWKQAVDQLFDVLDPLANTMATERKEAIDSFFILADCNPAAKHFTEGA